MIEAIPSTYTLPSGSIYPRIGFSTVLLQEFFSKIGTDRQLSNKFRQVLSSSQSTQQKSVESHDEEWEMLEQKLFRFRPRLLGAISSYGVATGQTHREMTESGTYEAFKLLWFLGSSQDDLIDGIPKDCVADLSKKEKIELITKTAFGNQFYRTIYATFIQNIDSSDLENSQKLYIKFKAADWYRFLFNQESDVLAVQDSQMDFDYCKNYRESQNSKITQALIACLNGKNCLDPRFQNLEYLFSIMSFRTQIIDDIADLKEDLGMHRPSFAVGAVNSNSAELDKVNSVLESDKIVKVTPKLFSALAPKSYSLVKDQFDRYGNQISSAGPNYRMLSSVEDLMFDHFPSFRDFMFKINPKYANF